MKQSDDLRGPDRTRAPRVGDRAPAPPAPGGLAGLCVASYASACVWPASRRGRIYEHGYLTRASGVMAGLVLLFVNTVTFALSAAASDARSEAEAMPGRIVEAERQSRRGPDRRRLVEPAIDRAPAPPAPEGLVGHEE